MIPATASPPETGCQQGSGQRGQPADIEGHAQGAVEVGADGDLGGSDEPDRVDDRANDRGHRGPADEAGGERDPDKGALSAGLADDAVGQVAGRRRVASPAAAATRQRGEAGVADDDRPRRGPRASSIAVTDAWARSTRTPTRSASAMASRPRPVRPPALRPVDEPASGVSMTWARPSIRTPRPARRSIRPRSAATTWPPWTPAKQRTDGSAAPACGAGSHHARRPPDAATQPSMRSRNASAMARSSSRMERGSPSAQKCGAERLPRRSLKRVATVKPMTSRPPSRARGRSTWP